MFIPIPPGNRRRRGMNAYGQPRAARLVVVATVAAAVGVSGAVRGGFRGWPHGGNGLQNVPIVVAVIVGVLIVGMVVRVMVTAQEDDRHDDPVPSADASMDTDDPDGADQARPIALAVVAALVAIGVAVVVFLLWSKPAAAQQPPVQTAILMLKGADTVIVDRITRAGTTVQTDVASHAGRFTAIADLTDLPAVPLLTLRQYGAGSGPDALPLQNITIRFGVDSAVLQASAGTQTQRFATAVPAGSLPIINGDFAFIELLIGRARKAGDSPHKERVYLVAGTGIAAEATVTLVGADSALVTIGSVVQRYALDANGRIAGGSVPAQGLRVERVTGAAAARVSLGRPDYGAPSDAPYTAEEVTVPTRAGHSLSGTLTIPKGMSGRVPAVVTITGSGQEDRDENIPLVPNYRPYRQLADTLGRRGIAVLRLDDRGINGSGGDVASATTADFADDIRAGVAFVRARPEIDPARVALVGHSEGGEIGPMVAATDPKLSALVILAGPAYTGRKIIDFQLRNLVMGDSSIAAGKKDSVAAARLAEFQTTAATSAWMKFFLDYDPVPTLRKVKAPVLILQGGTDQQVTPEQAPLIERTLKAAGNKDVTMKVFADHNHLFLNDPSGFPGGYAKLKDGHIGPEVMGPLADWLVLKLSRTPTP